MRIKYQAHFYDPETNKRLIVTDILRSGKVEYLKSIWMVPSRWNNQEIVTYFARNLAKKNIGV